MSIAPEAKSPGNGKTAQQAVTDLSMQRRLLIGALGGLAIGHKKSARRKVGPTGEPSACRKTLITNASPERRWDARGWFAT